MIMDLLRIASTATMLVFVIASMLGVGLGLTVGQIVAPLRNVRQVLLALLANFALMPLGAFIIAKLLQLDEPLVIGLLLLGTAGGAPFLPKLAETAKSNIPYSVGLMVLLMSVTVVYLPLALPVLLPGVSVDATKIAKSLVLLMLMPLTIGLAVKARFKGAAERLQPWMVRIGNISLILVVVLMLFINYQNMLDMIGTRAILSGVLLIGLGLGMGWFFGGPSRDTRAVLALGTGQRNVAAALVVGGQNFSDPTVVVTVIVIGIISFFMLIPLSVRIGRSQQSQVKE
jgi:BASS family bile acid:Na+ symporter